MNYKVLINNPDNKFILFLHGFMGSMNDWVYFTENLNGQFNFILIDLPGHGQSISLDESEYSIDETCENIKKIIQKENIKRCHLVGYSMGGRVGIALLTKFPELFYKVILESTTPGIESEKERAERKTNDKNLAQKIQNSDLASFLENWYNLGLWGNIKSHPDYDLMIKSRLLNIKDELAKSLIYSGTGNQNSYWDDVAMMGHDILFVAGELDNKYKEIANKFEAKVSSSKKFIAKNAAHNVHFEQKEIFLNLIKDHFGE